MGFTVYGGKTDNGLYVNDMIDGAHDIHIDSPNHLYFVRCVYYSNAEDFQQQDGLALAMFATGDEFKPVYAMKLSCDISHHRDLFEQRGFEHLLQDFWNIVQKLGYNVGVDNA